MPSSNSSSMITFGSNVRANSTAVQQLTVPEKSLSAPMNNECKYIGLGYRLFKLSNTQRMRSTSSSLIVVLMSVFTRSKISANSSGCSLWPTYFRICYKEPISITSLHWLRVSLHSFSTRACSSDLMYEFCGGRLILPKLLFLLIIYNIGNEKSMLCAIRFHCNNYLHRRMDSIRPSFRTICKTTEARELDSFIHKRRNTKF